MRSPRGGLELSVEERAVRWCERRGIPMLKFKPPGSNGWPDRLVLVYGGRPFFVEFKRQGGEADPLQAHTHEQMRSLGYDVEVCDSFEGFVRAVKLRLAARSVEP